ncbi:UDP-glucose--hexose-1-phosphate uridylyltransferase [Clostridium sp.]|uniref:UDP-glucose--hexose-1-phosphate uridylyltransferase n=1 Tax=Clostridium sp. TaxID=1506 RepID=UPI00262F3EC5|nr:UDP-glucose--hexose-1-phosphate uridylyltransferase [Clostridium sp.]
MKNLYSLIDRLICISIENTLISEIDTIYVRNRLLNLFKENSYEYCNEKLSLSLNETLTHLIEIALKKEIIDDTLCSKDIFSSNIMDIFIPSPSSINSKFRENYSISPKLATDYFYSLSKNSNYIRTDRISKNVNFKSNSKYGLMDITINLSKPEKDPKEIALARNSIKSNYPKCLLCVENEGYNGTLNHPDRANHRMIRLDLNKNNWFFQYSPYAYYNEHCIILSEKHSPMKITKDTFKNLLEFSKMFPHYFIGSNADLPIVGGSILSHEHYQGGNYTFPMHKALKLFDFKLNSFEDVHCEVINWPLSTIRLRGNNINSLVEASNLILENWRNYSDEDLEILSFTDNEHHNTITPMVRRSSDNFIVELSLRNNRTSKEHPLGIFHPHSEVHHIKKENIGLIEVMGLAVLPGRLLNELEDIKKFILGNCEISKVKEYHHPWSIYLKDKFKKENYSSIDTFIEDELSLKFSKVLEHCGVFKLNPKGIDGFKKFIDYVNAGHTSK